VNAASRVNGMDNFQKTPGEAEKLSFIFIII
jgi:hypothetical protein